MGSKGTLFLVSAPSGAGKTTLVTRLIQKLAHEHLLERVITYTSRKQRHNESNGFDYHFISETDFEKKAREGFFIEWSSVYGAYYGSPQSELIKLEQGISLCMILDLKGIKEVMSYYPSVTLWIAPPSMHALEKRLSKRGSYELDDRLFRLDLAKDELKQVSEHNVFDYTIVNDDLETAFDHLEGIVLHEMHRTKNLEAPAFAYTRAEKI